MGRMLADKRTIGEYVNKVSKCFPSWIEGHRGFSYHADRRTDLHKVIVELFDQCGVPRVQLGVSTNAGFDSKNWQIVDQSRTKPDKNISQEMIIDEVVMFYLLACHAERYWLSVIEKLLDQKGGSLSAASRSNFHEVSRTLGVSSTIAEKAYKAISSIGGASVGNSAVDSFGMDYALVEKELRGVLLKGFSSPNSTLVNAMQHMVTWESSLGVIVPFKEKAFATECITPATHLERATVNRVDILAPKFLQRVVRMAEPTILRNKSILDRTFFTPPDAPVLPPVRTASVVNIASQPYEAWPKLSMISPVCVNDYVYQVGLCWDQWKSGLGVPVGRRVFELHRILSDIHVRCGMPPINFSSFDSQDGPFVSDGLFTAATWTLELNNRLVNNLYQKQKNFLSIVEIAYHEARHAEQAWMVAVEWCFAVRTKESNGLYTISEKRLRELYFNSFKSDIDYGILQKAAKVACERPEIPQTISGEALKKRRAFVEMVTRWYESVYGTNRDKTAHVYNNLDSGTKESVAEYRNLPNEFDSYAIQGLIRRMHARMSDYDTDWDDPKGVIEDGVRIRTKTSRTKELASIPSKVTAVA